MSARIPGVQLQLLKRAVGAYWSSVDDQRKHGFYFSTGWARVGYRARLASSATKERAPVRSVPGRAPGSSPQYCQRPRHVYAG